MDGLGILSGLLVAVLHAFSYVASRWFLKRTGGTPALLLGISHAWMGLAALALLLALGPAAWPPFRVYGGPAFSTTAFYLVGQAGLFYALRRTDSSRVAPLLGLKVFLLALIGALFLGESLGLWRWTAVLLSVAAVFVLNESGGRLPASAWLGAGVAVLGYSLSDLYIKDLVTRLGPMGARAPLAGVAVTYLISAAVAPAWLVSRAARRPVLWTAALPYSAFWFASMIFLFIAFDRLGVVFGNILQSTRGLMAVGLGAALARLGMPDLETRLSAGVAWRRAAGAALMTAAIALYLMA